MKQNYSIVSRFTFLYANLNQEHNSSQDQANYEENRLGQDVVNCQRLQLSWFFPLHWFIGCFLVCLVFQSSLMTMYCLNSLLIVRAVSPWGLSCPPHPKELYF